MAVLFVTGTGGLNRDGIARELRDSVPEVEVYHIGNMLYERTEAPEGRILRRIGEEIAAERRAVFEDIRRAAADAEHVVILSHAIFRWPRQVFGWETRELEGLEFDSVCVLVDDVHKVKYRIRESGEYGGEDFSLKDLAEWRSQEITLTHELANSRDLRDDFYVVPRRDATEIIQKLLTRRNLPRIYISFPITHALGDDELMAEIEAYKRRIRDVSIGFDPYALEEKRLQGEMESAVERGEDAFEVEALDGTIEVGVEEVSRVLPDIDRQIVDRDFKLIDQSDEIIALVPEVSGRPEISAGVMSELWYAFYKGMKTTSIWQSSARPSPFLAYVSDSVFESIEECVESYEAEGGEA